MSEYIEIGQPLQFTDTNCPTRVGEIVENVNDIYNIPTPCVGMQVFVKSEKKSYVITALKSKTINGVEVPEAAVEAFEPVGAKEITWNNDTNPSNMNDFVVAGVYDIKGERTRDNDNLPILNTGGGHSFNARLTVLDSSISGSGKDDDKCITQVLSFSNRLGQGEVYIRTGKGSSLDSLTWEKWSTLQRNVNVKEVGSLDDLKDNGIYSGVWLQGHYNSYPITFVCVVINDYFIGIAPRRISQFVYGLSKFDGSVVYQSRVWDDSKDKWGDWEILNQKEISSMIKSSVDNAIKDVIADAPEAFDTLKEIADWIANDETAAVALANAISANTAAITAERTRAIGQEGLLNNAIAEEKSRAEQAEQTLYNKITAEVDRAQQAEQAIKDKAVEADSLNFQPRANVVALDYKTIEGVGDEITIPAATAEKAGVMSATDKVTLDSIPNEIEKLKDAPNLALRALLIAAGAEYNDTVADKTKTAPWGETVTHKAGHYYLNGLGDITEEQMLKIYVRGWFNAAEYAPLAYGGANSIRTNIGRVGMTNGAYSQGYFAYENTTIEVINCSSGFFNFDNPIRLFNGCTRLKVIIGNLWFANNSTSDFVGCAALQELQVRELSKNITLSNSPLVSKNSILYMIQKAKPAPTPPATVITITLHADAYARLANDADIVAALAAQPLVTLVSA